MRHAPFLKLTYRELQAGRMIDVDSVSICRCGKKFPTNEDMEAHILRPITVQLRTVEPEPVPPQAENSPSTPISTEPQLVEA